MDCFFFFFFNGEARQPFVRLVRLGGKGDHVCERVIHEGKPCFYLENKPASYVRSNLRAGKLAVHLHVSLPGEYLSRCKSLTSVRNSYSSKPVFSKVKSFQLCPLASHAKQNTRSLTLLSLRSTDVCINQRLSSIGHYNPDLDYMYVEL